MVTESGFEVARFGREKDDAPLVNIEERSFSPATKHGIAIGASREVVLAKLGQPTRTAVRGRSEEYWCALYKEVVMYNRETGLVLRNTYIFKHGKLIEIAVNLDSIPGCGETTLSDEGWPWSKF